MKNGILRMALLVGACVLITSFAQGLTVTDCTFDGDDCNTYDWIFEVNDNGTPGKISDDLYLLTLTEIIETASPGSVTVLGSTEYDPVIHYTKTITNTSGFDWTGYELIISGTNVSFDYTNLPTSDVFLNVDISDPMKIVFSSPNVVEDGMTVVLDFDVLVPDSGSFQICLEQIAIPEPATMLLLGVGGIVLLRRKRI